MNKHRNLPHLPLLVGLVGFLVMTASDAPGQSNTTAEQANTASGQSNTTASQSKTAADPFSTNNSPFNTSNSPSSTSGSPSSTSGSPFSTSGSPFKTARPGEQVERHLSGDQKFREWSLDQNVSEDVKRIKVCRVEDVCKMRFKEGETPRTRVRNLVVPLRYEDENIAISEAFTRQVRQ